MFMNLYKVSRTDPVDYDEYDSLVCAAPDAESALKMRPCLTMGWGTVSDPTGLQVEYLGLAVDEHGDPTYLEPTVILASFNAG